MKNKLLIYAIASLLLINILFIPSFSYAQPHENRPPFKWDIDPKKWERLRTMIPKLLLIKSVLSIISSTIIIILALNYYNIYRKTGSTFTLGLIVFSVALLLYSLTSNPLINNLLGLGLIGINSLLIVPDLFTLIASLVMLYLSQQ